MPRPLPLALGIMALCALGLAGCGWLDGHGADGPRIVPLGRPVTLAPGGRALLGDSTWVQFDRVVEDNRCPRRAECFVAGWARLRIVVSHNGPERIAPVVDTVTVGDDGTGRDVTCPPWGPCVQTIRLRPDLGGNEPVRPAQYRATFVGVRRAE